MWFFKAPEIIYGEGALEYLEQIGGRRAFIVTDAILHGLGFTAKVVAPLSRAGIECAWFAEVAPEPSVAMVRCGAAALTAFAPDWVIGLGGGSAIDAAKAMWVLYERPDLDPRAINPITPLGLRAKARLIAISTTSGTGSEATWATVLTDTSGQKLGLASREIVPDIAIVDPSLAANLPPAATAETGIDALVHAIEGYTCTWHNHFSDGLALKALDLVFRFLPRAVAKGAGDSEARAAMHNAATLGGLAFGNAAVALAHALGHALGAVFHVSHGRSVGLFLPYTIEYAVRGGQPTRYGDLARFLRLPDASESEAAASLARAIRALEGGIGMAASVAALGIAAAEFDAAMPRMVAFTEGDTQIVTATRVPDRADTAKLLRYAYEGRSIDF